MTYVPDDNFEQALIDLGIDTAPLNDSVPTKNIDNITYLDLSKKNISDLTGIEDFIVLTVLLCHINDLTSLDVSKNKALGVLFCYENSLKSLDLSKNADLTWLICDGNFITSLDVSKNTALDTLFCSNNNLTSLDISKNINLTVLHCFNNPDLYCIQVADSIDAISWWSWRKDSTAHYSENCNYTGIKDLKFENNSVSISPNPSSDYIEISVGAGSKPAQINDIHIFDILGTEVLNNSQLSIVNSQLRINVSTLAPGVYFVRVGDFVGRFVKY